MSSVITLREWNIIKTMKRYSCVTAFVLLMNIFSVRADQTSNVIFNDTVVNRYKITFYDTLWDSIIVANKVNDEIYMGARFIYYCPNGDSMVLDSVGIRYKGNSSYTFSGTSLKKPFKIYFNKYRKDQLFFGVEKLCFTNNVRDQSFLREVLSYGILARYMPSPRAVFACVTFEDKLVNALYTQVEQVDEYFLKRHFRDEDGHLFKSSDDGTTMGWNGINQNPYETEWELKSSDNLNDWVPFINMLNALNNSSDAEFIYNAGAYLDLDNCIRYLAFNMVNANFDSYTGSGRNLYMFFDTDVNKFKLIPWDYDQSFGMYSPGFDVFTVNAFSPPNIEQRPLIKRIMANDSLKKVYAHYLQAMINGPSHVDSVRAVAYRYRALIDPYVQADSNKFFTYEDFLTNIDSNIIKIEGPKKTVVPGVIPIVAARAEQVLAQINLPVIERLPTGNRRDAASFSCVYRVQNHVLTVRFSVPAEKTDIRLTVSAFDGRRIIADKRKIRKIGNHAIQLSTRSFPSGMYVISLRVGSVTESQKIVISR